jgi:hypothetical protein
MPPNELHIKIQRSPKNQKSNTTAFLEESTPLHFSLLLTLQPRLRGNLKWQVSSLALCGQFLQSRVASATLHSSVTSGLASKTKRQLAV